jgi:catechol 2,3-dioxygenase-like lactoylglutathione lyase family enzyme
VRFVGIRTERFEATVAVYRDALGLALVHESPGAAWFALDDGTQVHVYGPADDDHAFFGNAPCIGYLVEDFAAARAALIDAGCEFDFGEPQVADGTIWNHYRAPDGNVYEIIGRLSPATDP